MDFHQIIVWDKQLLLFLNGSDSVVWDQFMFLCTKTSVWIPLFLTLLYLVMKSNPFRKSLLLLACVGLLFFVAETVSSGIFKPLVARLRPTHDPEIMEMVRIVNGYRGGLYSFFSSHATNTFSLFMFLSLVVRSRSFTATMLCWAALHTYTRIYLGVHFPGDIMVGVLFGSCWGIVMYLIYGRLERKWFEQYEYVSEKTTESGYLNAAIDVVSLTFISSLLLIMIGSFFRY